MPWESLTAQFEKWLVFLVGQQDCSASFAQCETLLKKLSKTAEVAVYYLHENINICTLEYWNSGKKIWNIVRDAQIATDHLVAEGAAPSIFADLRDEALRQMTENTGRDCDFLLAVPELIAERICGVSLVTLDNSQFESLHSTPKSPLSATAKLESKTFEILDKVLERQGYLRAAKSREHYICDVGNGFTGILWIEVVRKYGFSITAHVGLKHEETDLLCDRLLGLKPQNYIAPTVSKALGHLCPQSSQMPTYVKTNKISRRCSKFSKNFQSTEFLL